MITTLSVGCTETGRLVTAVAVTVAETVAVAVNVAVLIEMEGVGDWDSDSTTTMVVGCATVMLVLVAVTELIGVEGLDWFTLMFCRERSAKVRAPAKPRMSRVITATRAMMIRRRRLNLVGVGIPRSICERGATG